MGDYYLYVIELDDEVGPRSNPEYPSVYVGQSAWLPENRFEQHKSGYKASRVVKRYGKWLRPRLYRPFNPLGSRDEALAGELRLAERLRAKGYTVFGGH